MAEKQPKKSREKLEEWVRDRLHDLDKVAYVRFASVYRQFQDVDQFMKTIRGLLDQRK